MSERPWLCLADMPMCGVGASLHELLRVSYDQLLTYA